MAGGIYNETYFKNNPEESNVPAVLYCVVLVNRQTFERECVKIGIAKGKGWKSTLKRATGFKGYEVRIQKTVDGPLEEIYHLEQYLHETWQHIRYFDALKFGGHTELFKIEFLPEILQSIPKEL